VIGYISNVDDFLKSKDLRMLQLCRSEHTYIHELQYLYTHASIHAYLHTCDPSLRPPASHRIASHRIASHRIASHRIASHRIASHRIALHRIASHRRAQGAREPGSLRAHARHSASFRLPTLRATPPRLRRPPTPPTSAASAGIED
jgi:hypothetical protein